MGADTQQRWQAEQNPTTETVAHLSEEAYYRRVTDLTEQVLSTLVRKKGALETVNLDVVLGCLRPVEDICSSNPFSVLEYSKYSLDSHDWEQVNRNDPVQGVIEQARRLLAGDVQRRMLRAVANDDTEIPVRTQRSRRQH